VRNWRRPSGPWQRGAGTSNRPDAGGWNPRTFARVARHRRMQGQARMFHVKHRVFPGPGDMSPPKSGHGATIGGPTGGRRER